MSRAARMWIFLWAGSVAAFLLLWASSGVGAIGTWGANAYPYLDGVVCSDGDVSSPLASWDFGTGGPAFLLAPVTTSHGVDSAHLPFATTGTQHTAAVQPGSDGFGSTGDIAAYANLIDQFAHAGSGTIAGAAQAIMNRSGSSQVPTCSGVSESTELFRLAASSAGPYTVRIDAPSGLAVMGSPTAVRATVLSARGLPVPGKTVTFSSTPPDSSLPSAVTDAGGVATVSITIPIGSTQSTIGIHASASTPIGLRELSADHTDVHAVYADQPIAYSGASTLTVDASVHPAVQVSSSISATVVGQPAPLYADVTGLTGHAAGVGFTVRGPLPLSDTGTCPAGSPPSTTPTAATTNTVNVTGDQRVTAVAWTPVTPGCYFVEATVSTSNATPNASAKSTPTSQSTISVLATTAVLTPENHVLGTGPIHASVLLSRTYAQSADVNADVIGPLTPVDHSCTKVDFGTSRKSAKFTASSAASDGAAPLTSSAITEPGCYRLTASATLTLPDRRSAQIPIAPVNVLVIAPRLATTVEQVWSISPAPVDAHVEVTGTESQPAHVALELAYLPPQPGGCGQADWSHATTAAPGTPVAVRADLSRVQARSGPTTALGCYLPVAKLSIDANPTIVVTAPISDPNNAISVGIDPNAARLLSVPRGTSDPLVPDRVIGAILVGLEIIAVLAAVLATGRTRRRR